MLCVIFMAYLISILIGFTYYLHFESRPMIYLYFDFGLKTSNLRRLC